MATKFSVGHAMRRRNGTPSSTLEAAGNMKARTHLTHHEAVDAAAQVGSPRLPISAAPALQGTLVPKKNTQAGDPTNPGSKANRQNIERIGATYRVTVPFTPTIDPAAGPTMANAKMIPSVAGRTGNFGQEAQTSTL
jgi:hypothetical protein